MGTYWGRAAYLKAKALLGTPYVFGGEGPPGGVDCSRLTQYGYGEVGIVLSRTTFEQCHEWPAAAPYSNGDLLFFRGSDPGPHGEPGHVGFFAGYGVIDPDQHSWRGSGLPASGALIILNAPYTGAKGGVRFDYALPLGPVVAHTRPGMARHDP
jgi:cell wall-associated NlpC family hydrolase